MGIWGTPCRFSRHSRRAIRRCHEGTSATGYERIARTRRVGCQPTSLHADLCLAETAFVLHMLHACGAVGPVRVRVAASPPPCVRALRLWLQLHIGDIALPYVKLFTSVAWVTKIVHIRV